MSKSALAACLALFTQLAAAADLPSSEEVRSALLDIFDGPPSMLSAIGEGHINVRQCHPVAGEAGRVSCQVDLLHGAESFSTVYDFVPVKGIWRIEPPSDQAD
jgi:hypothetical protein